VVLGPANALEDLVEELGLELVGEEQLREDLRASDIGLVEAVVPPRASIEGRTPAGLRLRSRYGVNVLAVARQGRPVEQRLRNVRFQAGDVLLLQGEADTLSETVADLGCLPLATRPPQLQPRRALMPALIFGAAIVAASVGLLPAAVALTAAVAAMVLTNILPAREVYASIDWPVVVLLGALIPVGGALETTGATQLIANGVVALVGDASPFLILALVLVVTMTLSDVMNNAATAVVMAPFALGLAHQIGVSADPFLMAVAVGASCAFLTPIGHQNNALVMGPGGYAFGDYWRLGLPLQVLIVATAVPLIPLVWPF
jgi:di/tricarboxylate transporter